MVGENLFQEIPNSWGNTSPIVDPCKPPNGEVFGTTGFEVPGRMEFGDFQYGIARRAFGIHLVIFPCGTYAQAEAQ